MSLRDFITCPKKRDAWWMAVGFVVVFAAGDRLLHRVRLPRVYGSTNGSLWKWEMYAQAQPPPDVVFLGSSYGLCGISPTAVDDRVRELTGTATTSLNLCAAATSVYTQYLLVRRIVECERVPALLYLEVTPEGTVAGAYHWLANGIRALGDVRDLPVAASVNGPLFAEGLRTVMFSSYRQWGDCRLIAQRLMIGAALQPKEKLQHDDRGWAKWIGGTRPTESDTAGLPPTSQGEGEDVFATFEEHKPNLRALRDAVKMLRDAGVTVRLLELPLRSTAPANIHPQKNPAYREFLQEAVSDLNVPVVRPPVGLLSDADFFDKGHLTAVGALKFSRWLANDVAVALAAGEQAD